MPSSAATDPARKRPTRPRALPPPRAFGSDPADLDLDFGADDRIALAVELVATCVDSTGERAGLRALAWALPVGERIARLLRIVALMDESGLALVVRCPHPECAQTLEIDLPLQRLLADEPGPANPDSAGSETTEVALPCGATIRLRRPTGLDQRAWRTRSFATQQEAVVGIVTSLTVSGSASPSLDPAEIDLLAGAMDDFDSLTAFRVATTCPHCAREASLEVDLEAEALRHFESSRRSLLRDIHILATRYGWSETGILAVPAPRRAQYRRWIEADTEGRLP